MSTPRLAALALVIALGSGPAFAAKTLAAVKMPNRNGFISLDPRKK